MGNETVKIKQEVTDTELKNNIIRHKITNTETRLEGQNGYPTKAIREPRKYNHHKPQVCKHNIITRRLKNTEYRTKL